MRNLVFVFISTAFIMSCATTGAKDIHVAHNACYSYSYGENGFEVDFQKALQWCSEAADLGSTSAQTLLAELYFFGRGVEQNLVKSASIYRRAALQGHVHAQLMVFQINNIYRASESTDEERSEGYEFLQKAVNAGYQKAIEVHNQIYGQKI